MLPKLMLIVVFVTLLLLRIHGSQALLAKPGCQETCGNVTIPYPFGIGADCYLQKSFEVFCNESSQDNAYLWFAKKRRFPIIEFSSDLVRVIDKSPIVCAYGNATVGDSLILDKYFFFSQDRNIYVAVGCNILASFGVHGDIPFTCKSICNEKRTSTTLAASDCNGLNGCCQLTIPQSMTSYAYLIKYFSEGSCVYAFILENNATFPLVEVVSPFASLYPIHVPVALNWVVALTTCQQARKNEYFCGKNSRCINSINGLGHNCRCRKGYTGNAYLPDGCQADSQECPKQSNHYCKDGETCVYTHGSYTCIFPHSHKWKVLGAITLGIIIGLSAFGAIGYWGYIKLSRIRKNKINKKFFEKNGGHLLKQHICANKSCIMTIKIYSAEEMERATANFSRSRFLGKGGQGTVYKGFLPDGTVVAIKKSNIIDVDQAKRFVNEVFILAQINHRNIVKLLGCCLEYQVPLLVYEYLANDTLSQYLHGQAVISTFSWKDRIRIAREVAGALAYLHSYASPSIIHRDIKPGNILLDNNYKAVVADFGLSRLVPLSRSHVTTQVDGTFGYLDPEFYQSGKLTAKSDVYSYGVVLTELLTRKKPSFLSESGEGLVPRFQHLIKHNRFVEILDKQVVQEAMVDDVYLVAKLAKRCIKTNSKKRPRMEEVVAALDKLALL